MLQQTQVSVVTPHYERFRDRFPTIEELAAATETDVLQQPQRVMDTPMVMARRPLK